MNLWKKLKRSLLLNPDKEISENDRKLTYSEFLQEVNRIASKVKNVYCCAILCESELNSAISVMACLSNGITALPLSKRYGEKHYRRIIESIDPDGIISDVGGEIHLVKREDSFYCHPKRKPTFIMCTSGSTGAPKGVMLSGEGIAQNCLDILTYFPISRDDRILIARPLYHSAVLTGEFFISVMKGADIYFLPGKFDPLKIVCEIEKRDITVFCGTPTLVGLMACYAKEELSSLRLISVSGEKIDRVTAEKIARLYVNAKIHFVYGLTEASPRVSHLPPELFPQLYDSVGYPLKSVKIKVFDENHKKVKKGQDGLLWVRGKNVMLGYYGDSAATSRVKRGKWLCTGDVANVCETGELKIKGRQDDMINKAGMNIYPQEIENALCSDGRVIECVAYGYQLKNEKVHIGLKVVGNFSSIAEVKTLCKNLLPEYEVPVKIELLPELPKTASGKKIRNYRNLDEGNM